MPISSTRDERVRPGLRGPGPATFGTWVKLPALETLELLAHAGFEFVVIDMEHSPLDLESAYRLIFGAQALGMAALVRVPDRSGSHLQRILDAGADGILVPQVSSVQEATDAVAGMTFAPQGRRGMGATSRAGRWGLSGASNYVDQGADIVRGIQIEDLATLQDLDPILDTPGLDAVFLGMGDLTMSTGLPADDPTITAAAASLLREAAARGLPCGTAVGSAEAVAAAAQQGFSFIMVSNDTSMFAHASNQTATATRQALDRAR